MAVRARTYGDRHCLRRTGASIKAARRPANDGPCAALRCNRLPPTRRDLARRRHTTHRSAYVRVDKPKIRRQQFPRSVLATSSPTRPTRATSSRGCYEDVARVGRLPVQLATLLPDWSAGGLLRFRAARLSVCWVVLQIPRARDTLDLLRTSR